MGKKSTWGTIALTPAKKAGKAATKQASKAARKASPTWSLFGSGSSPKKAAKAASPYPIISKFTQERDGSITGIVSNSKNFKTGSRITTSPVKKGAKAGQVVTTSSGSKYQLE